MHIGFLSVKIDTPLRLTTFGTSPQGEAKKESQRTREAPLGGGAVAYKATERGLLKALTSN